MAEMPVAEPSPTPGPTPTVEPYPAPTPTQSAYQENILTRFVAFLKDLFEVQPVYAAVSQTPAAVVAPIGEVYFLLSDHLGSTTITLNLDGSVKSEIRYDAWGKTRDNSGTTPTERRYTGQIEEEAGLYFYNARWYDSSLGRFIQADTIIPQQNNPISWDRYVYSNNNPVNYTDPTGHCPICTAIIGAAIGGMVGGIAYFSTNMNSFDSSEYWTAVGAGIVTGALIGSGVGILALPEVAATGGSISEVATTLINAGAGAGGSGIGYIVTSPNNFESDDFMVNTIIGGSVGGISGNIGGGLTGAALKTGTYIAGSEIQYVLTTDQWTPEGAKRAAIYGGVGAAFDIFPGLTLEGAKPPLVNSGIDPRSLILDPTFSSTYARQLAGYQLSVGVSS